MKLRVAITGASGFLGTALTQRLLAQGAEVHALSRRRPALPVAQWHAYDLVGALPAPAVFENVDAVVHAAFAMGTAGPALEELNFTAALRLRDAARERRRHFVFISSMSAHAHAASSYGRAKWAVEQQLDPAMDTIVRPGLIVGPGGVYARMMRSLRRMPVVPVFFGGSQPVQPIALDDLVEALVRILTRRLPGEFNLGSPTPLTIRELYASMLAAAHLHRPLLPCPGDLTVRILRGGERLGLRLPLTAENLLGQKHLQVFETAPSLARLDFSPKAPAELDWGLPP